MFCSKSTITYFISSGIVLAFVIHAVNADNAHSSIFSAISSAATNAFRNNGLLSPLFASPAPTDDARSARRGRQVAIDGFPNGLPESTPEGVKIALLSSQNGPDGEMGPIPGVADVDFPVFNAVPDTGFECGAQEFAGIYGDVDARCQVFHMCQPNGNVDSFLCPNGTVFNQQYFVCDWWYNVDCAASINFYALNEFIYTDNDEE